MKRAMKHWQDPVSALIGVWLVISPWVLDINGNLAAVGCFVLIGTLIVVVAVGAVFVLQAWEEWVEIILGAWLIGSPWVLEYTNIPNAMRNAMVCGAAVIVLALWELGTDDQMGGWLHRLTGSYRTPTHQ